MKSLAVFQGSEHEAFVLPGGEPAALLIHGFPGTPAEMRPLAEVLHAAGWTVHVPLLPGFGAQIASLGKYRYGDWVATITQALEAIRAAHQPTLLVGYSLGAALAIQAATAVSPDGLVLLAPFWRLDGGLQGTLLPILKWFLPRFHPFEKADFSAVKVRGMVESFAPDADLDDPEVQAALRGLAIPSSVIDELRKAGHAAYQLAGQVQVPTLVLQGTMDDVVKPAYTRQLVQHLSGPLHYREVLAGHRLVASALTAWPVVKEAILDFASDLRVCLPPMVGAENCLRGVQSSEIKGWGEAGHE